jgi:Holliday junction resolvase RusA-like endonuclease
MKIIIPGKPIAKARPKFARRGKSVTTYNPQESEEGKWLTLAIGQITEKLSGPIHLEAEFFMPIPESTSAKKRRLMLLGEIAHIKKPDLDNLIKFCKDCLNGIAWNDDAQVISINASKKYGDDAGTVLRILPV